MAVSAFKHFENDTAFLEFTSVDWEVNKASLKRFVIRPTTMEQVGTNALLDVASQLPGKFAKPSAVSTRAFPTDRTPENKAVQIANAAHKVVVGQLFLVSLLEQIENNRVRSRRFHPHEVPEHVRNLGRRDVLRVNDRLSMPDKPVQLPTISVGVMPWTSKYFLKSLKVSFALEYSPPPIKKSR